jgi:phosphatidylglycerophosphate synthase
MKKQAINLISWIVVGLYVPGWYVLKGLKFVFDKAFDWFDGLIP